MREDTVRVGSSRKGSLKRLEGLGYVIALGAFFYLPLDWEMGLGFFLVGSALVVVTDASGAGIVS